MQTVTKEVIFLFLVSPHKRAGSVLLSVKLRRRSQYSRCAAGQLCCLPESIPRAFITGKLQPLQHRSPTSSVMKFLFLFVLLFGLIKLWSYDIGLHLKEDTSGFISAVIATQSIGTPCCYQLTSADGRPKYTTHLYISRNLFLC